MTRSARALTDFDDDEPLPFPILLPPVDSPLLSDRPPIPQTRPIHKHGRLAAHINGRTNRTELGEVLDALLSG